VGVLEELLAGEILQIGVIDPTLGQRKDVLEQQQSNHEPGGAGGRPLSPNPASSHSQSAAPASYTSSCFMLMI
jgi:hypothetical protein